MQQKKGGPLYNYYAYVVKETFHDQYYSGTLSMPYAAKAITLSDPTWPYWIYIDFNINTVYHLNPFATGYYEVTEDITSAQLQVRKPVVAYFYSKNTGTGSPVINAEYLKEAYYFVPFYLGYQLSQRGHYKEALQWYKTIYDYTIEDETKRRLYQALQLDSASYVIDPVRGPNWLLDPLNPHLLAETRDDAYYKYTVSTIAQTFIDWGSAQFTLDTVESVSEASSLYEFAESLLSLNVLKQQPAECNTNIFQALSELFCTNPELKPYENLIERILENIPLGDSATVESEIDYVLNILTNGTGDVYTRLKQAEEYVEALDDIAAGYISVGIINSNSFLQLAQLGAMGIPGIEPGLTNMAGYIYSDTNHSLFVQSGGTGNYDTSWMSWPYGYTDKNGTSWVSGGRDQVNYMNQYQLLNIASEIDPVSAYNTVSAYPYPYIPFPDGLNFCIPVNPVYQWQYLSAQLYLFKIRNCMNIAGMKRELDPYAAPTDLYTGLPQIGSNGQLVIPGGQVIEPTIYRYEFLIERAKQITGVAQQVESAFLSALVQRDAEYYNIMKAKQDLSMANANVKLKQLQLNVANDQVDLAQLQKDKAQLSVDGLDQMINAGLNQYEQAMIGMYYTVAALNTVLYMLSSQDHIAASIGDTIIGIATNAPSKVAATATQEALAAVSIALTGSVNVLDATISASSIWAQQARRVQEWNYQKSLAQQDVKIANEQIKIAQDGVRVAGQDEQIAELQQTNASATIDYLNNKFTNADLYDWMSGVLQKVYSYFLQEATNVAKLAQVQIAFERQEALQSFIQDDYWQ
ncbi:MAG TPA: hypothetical protein VG603_01770, partial [Chitinophagales bacterium]|nr:hypothetical protein [Chitinophagales bacterium]